MASIMNLHLQYRLWISSLNEEINVLRIFDDYIKDCKTKTDDAQKIIQLDRYKALFVETRKELDNVRHELYLNKMKLAAMEKSGEAASDNFEESINHEGCKKQYHDFRDNFKALKREFKTIES